LSTTYLDTIQWTLPDMAAYFAAANIRVRHMTVGARYARCLMGTAYEGFIFGTMPFRDKCRLESNV
jgi:hypothetical protein